MLFLLSITAAPENLDKPRHKEDYLSEERLALLSSDELEEIAAQFLTHHAYLVEDKNRVTYENRDTDDLVEVRCGSIDLLRNEAETSAQYLRRVVENYLKVQNEAIQQTTDNMIKGLSTMLTPVLPDSLHTPQSFLVPPLDDAQHKTNHLLAGLSDILLSQKEVIEYSIRELQGQAKERDQKSNRQWLIATIIAVIALLVAVIFGLVPYLMSKPIS